MIKAGTQRGTGELFSEFEVKSSAECQSSSGAVPCPINLTNHAYWNLSGSFRRSIREQILRLRCDRYLPLDEHSVSNLLVLARAREGETYSPWLRREENGVRGGFVPIS